MRRSVRSLHAADDRRGFGGPDPRPPGNNDGDQFRCPVAGRHNHITLHGVYAELTFDDRLVAVTHYPDIGRRLAASGDFAAVFYGHSHQAEQLQRGACVALNPGEVMGRLGRSTYGLYDTVAGQAAIHDLRP